MNMNGGIRRQRVSLEMIGGSEVIVKLSSLNGHEAAAIILFQISFLR